MIFPAETWIFLADKACEIEESEIPETVVESGKTLREEVILEQARRIVDIVPIPIDNKILDRLGELENTLDIMLGGVE